MGKISKRLFKLLVFSVFSIPAVVVMLLNHTVFYFTRPLLMLVDWVVYDSVSKYESFGLTGYRYKVHNPSACVPDWFEDFLHWMKEDE